MSLRQLFFGLFFGVSVGQTGEMCVPPFSTGQTRAICMQSGCGYDGTGCSVCGAEPFANGHWMSFNGKQYKLYAAQTWANAITACHTDSAKLATFESETEYRHIAHLAGGAFWIGNFQPIGGGTTCALDTLQTCTTPATCSCDVTAPYNAYSDPLATPYRECLKSMGVAGTYYWEGESCVAANPFVCERSATYADWAALSGVAVKSFGVFTEETTCATALCAREGGTPVSMETAAKTASVWTATGTTSAVIGGSSLGTKLVSTYPVWVWGNGAGFLPETGVYQAWNGVTYKAADTMYQGLSESAGKWDTGHLPPKGTEHLVCQRSTQVLTPVLGACSTLVGVPAASLLFHISFTAAGPGATIATEVDGAWPGVPVYMNTQSATNVDATSPAADNTGMSFADGAEANEVLFPSQLAYPVGYPTKDFTVCFWAKGLAARSGSVFSVDYLDGTSNDYSSGYAMRFVGSFLLMKAHGKNFLDGTPHASVVAIPISAFSAFDWTWMCFTHSSATGHLTTFVDNVQRSVSAEKISEVTLNGRGYGRGLGLMGNTPTGTKSSSRYVVDELSVFNVVLTLPQMVLASQCGAAPTAAPTSAPPTPSPPTPSPPTPSPPTPAPPTPAPVTPSPPTPAPATPSPPTPSPPTPAPATPAPVTPAPATSAPPTPSPPTPSPPTPAPVTPSPPTPSPPTPAPATPSPPTPSPPTPAPPTPAPVTPSPPTPAPVTPSPATSAPPTPSPSTNSPPTPSPLTPSPETPAPITPAPPTVSPPTPFPPTSAPLSPSPPTPAPSTPAPPTLPPSTSAPATQTPLTPAPATPSPPTPAPLSPAPATSAPITSSPPTPAPLTQAPASPAPLTQSPLTRPPLTPAPLTPAPLTAAPPTAAPSTQPPATRAPLTTAPLTTAPLTTAPLTAAPDTETPVTAAPATLVPSAAVVTEAPTAPTTSAPATRTPTTPAPADTLAPRRRTAAPLAAMSASPMGVAIALSMQTPATTSEEVKAGTAEIVIVLEHAEWQPPISVGVGPGHDVVVVGGALEKGFIAHALEDGFLTTAVVDKTLTISMRESNNFGADTDETIQLAFSPEAFSAPVVLPSESLSYSITKTDGPISPKTKEVIESVALVTSFSSPANAGRTNSLLQLMNCPMDLGAGQMSWAENPLKLTLTGFDSPGRAGAIAGNTILVAASLLTHFLIALMILAYRKVMDRRNATLIMAMSRARFPSYSFLPAMLFFQTTIESATHVLKTEPDVVRKLLPIGVMLTYCLGLIVIVAYAVKDSVFEGTFEKCDRPPSACGKLIRIFAGKGDWRSPNEDNFVWRYGLTYRDFWPHSHRFMLIEIGFSGGIGVINGIEMTKRSSCRVQLILLLALFLLYTFVLMWKRPYHAVANNICGIGGALAQSCAILCILLHLSGNNPESFAGHLALGFIFTSLCFLIPKSLIELTGAIYDLADRAPVHTHSYTGSVKKAFVDLDVVPNPFGMEQNMTFASNPLLDESRGELLTPLSPTLGSAVALEEFGRSRRGSGLLSPSTPQSLSLSTAQIEDGFASLSPSRSRRASRCATPRAYRALQSSVTDASTSRQSSVITPLSGGSFDTPPAVDERDIARRMSRRCAPLVGVRVIT